MFYEIIGLALLGCLALVYQALRPPPPKICGTQGGPPVTGPRIKLRDGRYLAYKEHGVSKETAKYKIVFVHGTSTNKHDAFIAKSKLVEDLELYIVSFDRPGYGESDPHPKRTIKTTALDIEDLADQLGLGPTFHVVGYSMGGQAVWGCLKYIPHRLAGAGLISPAINFWWPGFPKNLHAVETFVDNWDLRVTHYAPWLLYWWSTQRWFLDKSQKTKLTPKDMEIMSQLHAASHPAVYSTKQGVHESYNRDKMVGFGKWEFDPMTVEDPFVSGSGSVHLWQGDKDGLVPVELQRYIAKRLPWINYHEVPNAGHLFPYADDAKDVILKTLFT